MLHKNSVSFSVSAKNALFTDPVTKIGGEKCSYHIPTYEALKGIVKSVYWKPTFVWIIDKLRVMNPVKTQSKCTKPRIYGGNNHDLAIYTYLTNVEYQVLAHFEWNLHRDDLAADRIDGKHFAIANRMIEKGGRQDIFLGTRECQGYVEPCEFGEGDGYYDNAGECAYGLMFHGFDYPDETGTDELNTRFWNPVMNNGVVEFSPPEKCEIRRFVRKMKAGNPASAGLNEEALVYELGQ
jgi:CRISPR-associated protein Cas5d